MESSAEPPWPAVLTGIGETKTVSRATAVAVKMVVLIISFDFGRRSREQRSGIGRSRLGL